MLHRIQSPVRSNQPRSQGLSSSRPREQERRDPGWVWSRVSQRKIRPREGSFTCYFLSRFIFDSKTRLPLCCAKPTRNSFNWLCFSVVFILRVIVTLIGLKLNKVRCLEALYFGKSLCINGKINSGRTVPSPRGLPLQFMEL